jgi:4-hydroxythreonine-4-phosphate dehydrogenase
MAIIGITIGDPTGIGPEIIKKVLSANTFAHKIIIYGALPDSIVFDNIAIISNSKEIKQADSNVLWYPVMKEEKFIPSNPSRASGLAAYSAIKKAGEDALNGYIDAIVTAPLSKHHIQLSHSDFIGHTEFFARQANCPEVVMSFFSDKLNVGLLTTHCALSDVSSHLNIEMVVSKMHIINNALIKFFHITNPKLALLGLNPHAGEEGAFGNEELHILMPAMEILQDQDVDISGPYPADTFFACDYSTYDMIIASYHDQGLIPFKMIAFDTGVNVTLGLPYIRTSVDHGTAFGIAGKNKASERSLLSAIALAEKMLS